MRLFDSDDRSLELAHVLTAAAAVVLFAVVLERAWNGLDVGLRDFAEAFGIILLAGGLSQTAVGGGRWLQGDRSPPAA